ncbi:MAG: glycosyltransferase family 4 protein [Lachnospiraceae bacterium]|nr:glycosyltransferase family 4 protein [Lachnospiraceae bacterium]
MRVLWICNIMLPRIAEKLGQEVNNKEGWLTGLMDAVLAHNASDKEHAVQLGIAFPIAKEQDFLQDALVINEDYDVPFYGFRENVLSADQYDVSMEADMTRILAHFKPDIVHCFGTEYPHTLAAIKCFGRPQRTLVGIQGLCRVYATGYMASLPKRVQNSVTFRDLIKKDSLKKQKQKYEDRGQWELAAVQGTGHVTGRTHWDKFWTGKWNPNAAYHVMQETLRKEFYSGKWSLDTCEPHSLFLSQGDYPIKGLHYMLQAMPRILEEFPDTKVYVAGNGILRSKNIIGRLKISSYGIYLEKLIRDYKLEGKIVFLGKLNAQQMKEAYLKSQAFVCPSTMENSPNSLGEAMILGVPVVTTDIGGITSMIGPDEGAIYEGFRVELSDEPGQFELISSRLAEAVIYSFQNPVEACAKAEKARAHANKTHNGDVNNKRLLEIYQTMMLCE